jgi:hypothetical protein
LIIISRINPAQIKIKLTQLAKAYDVDEIIAVTITEDFGDRLQSYGLLANAFDLKQTADCL